MRVPLRTSSSKCGVWERGLWTPKAKSVLGIRLYHSSKDSPVLKVAKHWGRFSREIMVRNTIC